ncbi:hypothetical protein [Streptomyces sp. NPDC056549]|uniref:hypothetical protein n=1 Tax=Streptomyces sp. NPDC056549 TaxID=3345864 RepID=UPI00367E1316
MIYSDYSEYLGTLLRTCPSPHLNGGVNKGSCMRHWTTILPPGGRARKLAVVVAVVVTACALVAGYRWWSAERRGALAVVVKELPSGTAADVTVRGPDGFQRHVTASRTFDDVPAGRYTLEIAPVRGAEADVHPTHPTVTVSVKAGVTESAEAVYANVVPHTTKVLDASRLGSAGDVTDNGLVFGHDAPHAARLAVGDVIVAGIGPKTPEGLIRRVTATRRDNRGRLVVDTKPATLRDALPKGRIDVRDVRPDSPRSGPAGASRALFAPGAGNGSAAQVKKADDPGSGVESGSDGTFTISALLRRGTLIDNKLDFECSAALTSNPLQQISLGGQQPRLGEFSADWDWSGVHKVRYAFTLAESARIKVHMPASERNKCAFKFREPDPAVEVAAFTLLVGPVPVVIVMEVSMVASLEGTLKSDLSFDLGQQATLTAGMEWKGGRKTPIASFENEFKLHKGPTFALEGSAKAGLRIGTKIYGAAGPYLDITPGYKIAEVDEIGGQSKAELKGGLYTAAGIEFSPWRGADGRPTAAVEISDLYHIEKVLKSYVWNASPTPSPSKTDPGKEAACPPEDGIRQAIEKLITGPVDPGAPFLGRYKCWNGWVAQVWSGEPASDFVVISVFHRDHSRLKPAVDLLPVMDDSADPDWVRDCRKLRRLKPPAGLIDFVGCER